MLMSGEATVCGPVLPIRARRVYRSPLGSKGVEPLLWGCPHSPILGGLEMRSAKSLQLNAACGWSFSPKLVLVLASARTCAQAGEK